MKNKKFILFSSIIGGAILLIVLLLFTLFRTNSVAFDFKNQTTKFASLDVQNQIAKSDCISYKTPVFFLNKNQIKQKLEKQNEYLKIINIETVFPNKLIVHCLEREELFMIKNGTNIFVVDGDFKVLNILPETPENLAPSQGKAVLIDNVIINNPSANIGDFLEVGDKQLFINLYNAYIVNGKDISQIKAMYKSIKLSHEINFYTAHNEAVLTIIDYNDFKTEILLPYKNLNAKVQTMLSVASTLLPDKYQTYFLRVEEQIKNEEYVVTAKLVKYDNE